MPKENNCLQISMECLLVVSLKLHLNSELNGIYLSPQVSRTNIQLMFITGLIQVTSIPLHSNLSSQVSVNSEYNGNQFTTEVALR